MKYYEGIISDGPGTLSSHFVVQLTDAGRFPIPLASSTSSVLIEEIGAERFFEFLNIHGGETPFGRPGKGNEAFYATYKQSEAAQ